MTREEWHLVEVERDGQWRPYDPIGQGRRVEYATKAQAADVARWVRGKVRVVPVKD